MNVWLRYVPWLLTGILFVYTELDHPEDIGYFTLFYSKLFFILFCIGWYDLLQQQHAINRNYPLIGHLRYLLEAIRPEIRQYFVESDEDEVPFSRAQRSLVYQRAKGESSNRPFGTLSQIEKKGYQTLLYSLRPAPILTPQQLRVSVGNHQCRLPYSISLFNISAMSFGALSANAIMALNRGAQLGQFIQDTGEGSVSQYHLKHQGDLIWQIASGYFGCRDHNGHFSLEKFKEVSQLPSIKMIEVKLSQGAKPGHGGVLPGAKVTREIAQTRSIPEGETCVSPATHSAFSTPIELLHFINVLREHSGGKPVGIKLCIGQPKEWFALVKAMLATGFHPDFIVVDGAEGGTGSAPIEFVDHVGLPLKEGLHLVHQSLIASGLREKINIGASGKIISGFDLLKVIALGADWGNSARGFMFALGCIQSLACHLDTCPTGIATQNKQRQKALNPEDKAVRVAHFHHATLIAFAELTASIGVQEPSLINPKFIMERQSDGQLAPMSKRLYTLPQGSFTNLSQPLDYISDVPKEIIDAWNESMMTQF
ncbi:MAG: FMN-binding glutamate synthase family protein [Ferrovum sp. 37-45-19]|jgi:glutamate synthase domain-containing protein 2|nr:MAG: FMN-binding glutamate synthase family protein [Ferrovum sp. 21-44-67]OYV94247.1 MAG: FMN-binding glutamate synthase family protein [Ferrovum sp. 37-45-19]HQT81721.1 FMN-binding glutamate synthase family protein [Ferrovaceae bacterium]HQU07023.1 FMN-binding glutamate synthase family protein [Ferrovaceae bacterium]